MASAGKVPVAMSGTGKMNVISLEARIEEQGKG
jgi:hypothetical protein